MAFFDNALLIAILITIAMMVYAKLKNQTLKECWDEVTELFSAPAAPIEPEYAF